MKKLTSTLLIVGIVAIFAVIIDADQRIREHYIFSKVTNLLAVNSPQEVTIAAEGEGVGNTDPGVYSLSTPLKSQYQFTCADTDNCRLTLGETAIADGQILEILNVGTPTIVVTEVSNVVEGAGSITLGIHDFIAFRYNGAVWVEVQRSNN
jgi:hypothetical protein